MTVTTEERGRLNLYATEPPIYLDPTYDPMRPEYETHWERAERLNGRLAMVGVIFAIAQLAGLY